VYKDKVKIKKIAKQRIRKRVRKKVRGTSERPRVYVFKSNRYLYTQVIDDEKNRVIISASTLEKSFKNENKNFKNIEAAKILGKMLANRLKERKIEKIVFDRGSYPYHGRVKAIAEALREVGLVF